MDGSTMRVDAAASIAKILGAARRAFSLGDGSPSGTGRGR